MLFNLSKFNKTAFAQNNEEKLKVIESGAEANTTVVFDEKGTKITDGGSQSGIEYLGESKGIKSLARGITTKVASRALAKGVKWSVFVPKTIKGSTGDYSFIARSKD